MMYLDIIQYVQTDGKAINRGYMDIVLKLLQEMVQSDAEYLVGTYCLACEPHTRKDWETYQDNHVSKYELYTSIRETLPKEIEDLKNKIAQAAKVRTKVYLDTEFQRVLTGYKKDWLPKQ